MENESTDSKLGMDDLFNEFGFKTFAIIKKKSKTVEIQEFPQEIEEKDYRDEVEYLRKKLDEKDQQILTQQTRTYEANNKIEKLNDKIKELQTEQIVKLENIIEGNNNSITLLSEKIKNLENTIKELQDLIQPRSITKEDFERKLAQFLD